MGWGAGPAQAVKLMQRMIGAVDDGNIGPKTVAAYVAWLEDRPARDFADIRNAFYDQIIQVDPAKAKYRKGSRNRTAYFAPGGDGWDKFAA